MEWLNYHHLFYFSVIVQEGGLAAASRKLNLTHSTLSTQLRTLEDSLGTPLFERHGKRLVLTTFGGEVASYADEIFRLGRELNEVAQRRARPGRETIRIGVLPSIPKTLVRHLLAPALDVLGEGSALVRQDGQRNLVSALSAGRISAVLTNEVPAMQPGSAVHVHALGETEILLYARADLATVARRDFPRTLDGLPFVLPPGGTPLRRRLDEWFAQRRLRVGVRVEVDDAGLLRAFGSAGRGIFPVRAALRTEVEDLHDVELVCRCEGVRERFYVLTRESRITHPALTALVAGAQTDLHALALNTGDAGRLPEDAAPEADGEPGRHE